MRRRALLLMLTFLSLAVPRMGHLQAQEKQGPAPLALKVGDEAPDFTLLDTDMKQVTLSSFRGKKNVALAFYIFAFTGG
jgi:cytochrome oxidase Cu insertion factor (SCO1/SenC/PrrC family)